LIIHLIIRKFRSIENVDIRLGSMNGFVGPNNFGKSNVLAPLKWKAIKAH